MTMKFSSIAALRVFGDDLDPEGVSRLLAATPSSSYRKGDVEVSSAGRRNVRRTGMWCLEASGGAHDSLQNQVSRILSGLASDLEIWRSLQQRFQIDMYCGFFMGESSEELEISAAVMGLLAERGILLAVCMYGPDGPPLELDSPCPCRSGRTYGDCCGIWMTAEIRDGNAGDIPSSIRSGRRFRGVPHLRGSVSNPGLNRLNLIRKFQMSIEEIEASVLDLPQDQRAQLAASLLTSLPAVLDEEDEGIEEAIRRSKELDVDPASSCTWDDIRNTLRKNP